MTCQGPVTAAGPCSACGAYTDGLHAPGDSPTAVYGPCCCPGEHRRAPVSPDQRLALEVAMHTLHTLGHRVPSRFSAAKAIELCRAHAGELPEELRRLLP